MNYKMILYLTAQIVRAVGVLLLLPLLIVWHWRTLRMGSVLRRQRAARRS